MMVPWATELPSGSELHYCAQFLTPAEADRAFDQLLHEIAFRQEHIVLFGKTIAQPRLSLWMGDEGATYTYSGVTRRPSPWSASVRELRDRIAKETRAEYDSVLSNLYRDGKDSMGFHADDEPELGPAPVIASLSLGAKRTFVLKPRKGAPAATRSERIVLEHGSLLVMSGALQRHFHHGVPKEPAITAPRINLTFRRIFR